MSLPLPLLGAPASASKKSPPPTRAAAAPNPGFGVSTGTPAQLGTTENLEDRIAQIQNEMDGIQEQLSCCGEQQVNIAGKWFRSKVELKAWMKIHLKDEDLYICFADPSSLLNMGSQTGGDNQDVMAFKSDIRKAGYSHEYVGLAEMSFNFALPVMFGKETGELGCRDARVLPGLKNPEHWDGPNPYTGRKQEANRQLMEVDGVLQDYLRSDLMSPEARVVAQECLCRSKVFLAGLFAWMTNTYQFGLREKRAPEPLWKYISYCVREVFNSLHKARRAGRLPKATTCDRLWGFLQGIRMADEFMRANYDGHPVLSHVLTVHLYDQVVMKDQFEEKFKAMEEQFEEKFKAMEESIKKAQDLANAANQAAQRALRHYDGTNNNNIMMEKHTD